MNEELYVFLPFPPKFWEEYKAMEGHWDTNSSFVLNKEEFDKRVKEGWMQKFMFKWKNNTLKVSFLHFSYARRKLEQQMCMDGGLFIRQPHVVKNDNSRTTSAKDLLNALLSFDNMKDEAMFLKAAGWPVDIEVPPDIVEKVKWISDKEKRHWLIRGSQPEETFSYVVGREPDMQRALNMLMSARKDLSQWDIYYKVLDRHHTPEEWKLWESKPQHNDHIDWKTVKHF